MPSIFIDGKKIEAHEGQTIIQAAYDNGMQIPHFCWHPELSVAGNCRMCLVEVGTPRRTPDGGFSKDENGNIEIGYFPKLQIACATIVSDGMHVNINNKKVIEAQEAVMEFLLINHPLDCPICDEAGECKLQEYAYKHSRGESRFEEIKNRKEKRQRWGPNVIFDAERCISCSRCIRYAKEEAKQDVLTFVQRGDHVTIKLFEGTEFDNPYSMNVIEICPVGALTSQQFRFESRVWDMSFNPSITPNDSTGANIKIGVRNNQILRVNPGTNLYVNRYWLTDEQRLNHIDYVNENRVTAPMLKDGGTLKETTWQDAYMFAADKLGEFKPDEIFVLGSGKLSNECAYVLQRFATEVIKTQNTGFLPHRKDSLRDDFLLEADKLPNAMGAKETGLKPGPKGYKAEELAELISNGKIRALYVAEEDFSYHKEIFEELDKLDLLIVHAYNKGSLADKADAVFPASTYAEIEGTFTNRDKRVQLLRPALVTKENLRYMNMKMSRLDKFGSHNDRWSQHEQRDCRQSWRIITGLANLMGANWDYKRSEHVFEDIVSKISSFNSMNYKKIEEYQGLVLGKGDKPDPKIINYVSHYMKPD
ncbi:MAG: molybdopterin-dependent oxidoreductase [Candidatus Kapaibacterium sp.]